MKGLCRVTYIKHSGVLVELDHSYLLFDYWQGQIPPLDPGKKLYVFSSHAHKDHYTKDIFKLEGKCVNVRYILSSDIRDADSSWNVAEQVSFLDPCTKTRIEDLEIRTLLSTDEGLAFLVKTGGLTIYHAGDLHWWYWPGDPEEDNMGRRQKNYLAEIRKLEQEEIDLSFVVLDPRQGEAGTYGMTQFLSRVRSRYVLPIHFWEDYTFVEDYRKEHDARYPASCILPVTGQGQSWDLDL